VLHADCDRRPDEESRGRGVEGPIGLGIGGLNECLLSVVLVPVIAHFFVGGIKTALYRTSNVKLAGSVGTAKLHQNLRPFQFCSFLLHELVDGKSSRCSLEKVCAVHVDDVRISQYLHGNAGRHLEADFDAVDKAGRRGLIRRGGAVRVGGVGGLGRGAVGAL
jgi:hypothetical protein